MSSIDVTDLELRGIAKAFGGNCALRDVSVGLEHGLVTCIVGPNGAGKTTLFNVVSGFVTPDTGEVLYRGRRINGLPAHEVARLGIGRLFQDVRVFTRMTLLENVTVASKRNVAENPAVALCWPWIGGKEEKENIERARGYLEFVGLAELASYCAEDVSYGQQKLLAVARLLNNDADCFLLDEPTAGVNPERVIDLLTVIRKLAESGHAVVVIEHNLQSVRQLADWVYVMDAGSIEAFGSPSEVLHDSALQRLFPSL
jgi:ABC-type branched-subunit amino acid transport system ATPase component